MQTEIITQASFLSVNVNSHPVAITHNIIYIVSRDEQPYTKKENRDKSFFI